MNDFLYCKIDKRVPGGAMQFLGLGTKNGRTSRVRQYLSYNGKKANRSDDTYGFDEPLGYPRCLCIRCCVASSIDVAWILNTFQCIIRLRAVFFHSLSSYCWPSQIDLLGSLYLSISRGECLIILSVVIEERLEPRRMTSRQSLVWKSSIRANWWKPDVFQHIQ